jgi:hypothetical protein
VQHPEEDRAGVGPERPQRVAVALADARVLLPRDLDERAALQDPPGTLAIPLGQPARLAAPEVLLFLVRVVRHDEASLRAEGALEVRLCPRRDPELAHEVRHLSRLERPDVHLEEQALHREEVDEPLRLAQVTAGGGQTVGLQGLDRPDAPAGVDRVRADEGLL